MSAVRVSIIDGVRRRNLLRKLDFLLTRQYWYPVVLAKGLLRDRGVDIRFFERPIREAIDCDILVISSRQHDHVHGTAKDPHGRAEAAANLASMGPKVIWFDLRDSSGTPQFEVLPFVSLYVKQFLMANLKAYETPMYGGRCFSDYYHRRFHVTDNLTRGSDDQEEDFVPLDPRWAEKIVVGWDMSYDYRRHWSSLAEQIRNVAQEAMRATVRGAARLDFHDPDCERAYDMSAMFSTGRYFRATVAYQRRLALRRIEDLPGKVFKGRVPRGQFVRTLRNSRIVLSCFGNGEVCYREHEAWVAGAAVIMPDMGHLRTWPRRYRKGETYAAVDWDLQNLPEVYERLRGNERERRELAHAGQAVMRQMFSAGGLELFADRFVKILTCTDPDIDIVSSRVRS